MDGETRPLRAMKDVNRATQDSIIVSFIAILCSYYWVTSIWPMIQRRLDLQREKMETMAKLKRKQMMESDTAESKHVTNLVHTEEIMNDVADGSTQCQAKKRFDLKSSVQKNSDVDQSKDDVTEEPTPLDTLRGKYKDNAYLSQKNLPVIENDGEMSVIPVSSNLDTTEENAKADQSSETKKTDDLNVLWSHISRTTSNATYNVYSEASEENPWTQISTPPRAGNSQVESFAETRNLRALQDAEYASGLAADNEKKAVVEETAEKKAEREKKIAQRKSAQEYLDDEPDEDVEGVLTISFRFQVVKQNDLYCPSDNTDGSPPLTFSQRCADKAHTVNRRFSCYHKLSTLFNFIECHNFCPLYFTTLEILLFHPKRSFTRENQSVVLTDLGIISDTVVWVRITDVEE